MTTPQYPGYPGDGSQSGYNSQGGGAPGYGVQQPGYGHNPQASAAPGYGPQPGYGDQPGSNQQAGYGPQPGGAPGYGPQVGAAPGYGPQPGMDTGGGMPPYPGGAMGGVPMSVGDGLSWAWSKFKDNALILVAGIGVWSILSLLGGFNFHVTLNGQEYGVGLGVPFGGYISAAASLFAPMVTANMSLKVATGRPLEWNDLFSFPNVIAGLLAAFLSYVAMIPAALLCGFPAFIVLFLFYYSVYFTVDKGVDGIAGMGASWNILSSHVGELLPFALTGAGLYIVGGITVFGWLVTVPLAVLMTGYSYVRIQGYDVVR